MISLAYYSTASGPLSAVDLGEIVEQARQKNAKHHVTGMLCHLDGSFLQFLEGPEGAVQATFDRIKLDPRHRSVLEVHRKPIVERAFEDWSMALVRPQDVTDAQQAFCVSLRDVEIHADAEHYSAISGFLETFKAWLR